MKARDEFLEHAGVYGKKYGTPREWVVEQLKRGRLVILEIDVQGAAQVKAKLPDAFAVFILPPGEQELLNRLEARKREDGDLIRKRFAQAKAEIEAARAGSVYDRFIVNRDVQDAIREAVDEVLAARRRRAANRHPGPSGLS